MPGSKVSVGRLGSVLIGPTERSKVIKPVGRGGGAAHEKGRAAAGLGRGLEAGSGSIRIWLVDAVERLPSETVVVSVRAALLLGAVV